MSEKQGNEENPALSCEICLQDIDHEKAETFEVEDYVHHFCGLDCYSKWQHTKPDGEKKKED